jgi:hypothetical protein
MPPLWPFRLRVPKDSVLVTDLRELLRKATDQDREAVPVVCLVSR